MIEEGHRGLFSQTTSTKKHFSPVQRSCAIVIVCHPILLSSRKTAADRSAARIAPPTRRRKWMYVSAGQVGISGTCLSRQALEESLNSVLEISKVVAITYIRHSCICHVPGNSPLLRCVSCNDRYYSPRFLRVLVRDLMGIEPFLQLHPAPEPYVAALTAEWPVS